MSPIAFSIIIPHRNATNLLKRCLNSIPERNDLQIIVVDDGSEAKIIEELKRISRENLQILYSTPCKGAGHARNLGLEKALGKWILFADCDDFYEPEFNSFLNDNIDSCADCIYFSVNSVDSTTYSPGPRNFSYDEYISKFNPNVTRSEDWILFHKWEPWNKMISRTLIQKHHLKFDEFTKCNDMMFNIMVSFYAEKIKIIPNHLYCVTYNPGSMTFRRTKPEEFRDCLWAFKKKNIIMHKIGHWHWHMPMIIQHRFFIKKEGILPYFRLLAFYIRHYFAMIKAIRQFKKSLKTVQMVPKKIVD